MRDWLEERDKADVAVGKRVKNGWGSNTGGYALEREVVLVLKGLEDVDDDLNVERVITFDDAVVCFVVAGRGRVSKNEERGATTAHLSLGRWCCASSLLGQKALVKKRRKACGELTLQGGSRYQRKAA